MGGFAVNVRYVRILLSGPNVFHEPQTIRIDAVRIENADGPGGLLQDRSGLQCCSSNGGGALDPRDGWLAKLGSFLPWVGDPINAQTGNFSYSYVDLQLGTSAGPLQFQRAYASTATGLYTDTLGYGWSHNQDIRLLRPGDPGGQAGGIWRVAE
jgi:hypothetical protein